MHNAHSHIHRNTYTHKKGGKYTRSIQVLTYTLHTQTHTRGPRVHTRVNMHGQRLGSAEAAARVDTRRSLGTGRCSPLVRIVPCSALAGILVLCSAGQNSCLASCAGQSSRGQPRQQTFPASDPGTGSDPQDVSTLACHCENIRVITSQPDCEFIFCLLTGTTR